VAACVAHVAESVMSAQVATKVHLVFVLLIIIVGLGCCSFSCHVWFLFFGVVLGCCSF